MASQWDFSVSFFQDLNSQPLWLKVRKELIDFAKLHRPIRVLDVGCGTGHLCIDLSKKAREVVGVDSSEKMIKQAIINAVDRKNCIFIKGDAMSLPFHDDSFDAVFSMSVMYLLPSYIKGFKEALRVLKPGGIFVMLNPSEYMNQKNIAAFVEKNKIGGFMGDALFDWKGAALSHHRFSERELKAIFLDWELNPQFEFLMNRCAIMTKVRKN